jgi:hypothetical protein
VGEKPQCASDFLLRIKGLESPARPCKPAAEHNEKQGASPLSKQEQLKSAQWVRPEVKKLDAGAAEANGTGINDGGPVGNARS